MNSTDIVYMVQNYKIISYVECFLLFFEEIMLKNTF